MSIQSRTFLWYNSRVSSATSPFSCNILVIQLFGHFNNGHIHISYSELGGPILMKCTHQKFQKLEVLLTLLWILDVWQEAHWTDKIPHWTFPDYHLKIVLHAGPTYLALAVGQVHDLCTQKIYSLLS